MTSEEFAARYRLVQQVTSGGVRTFHATSPAGGVVMVHFVDAEELRRHVLERIERLPESEHQRLLEIIEVDGQPVVVTRFILDFVSLEDWLGRGADEPGTGTTTAPPGHQPGPATQVPTGPTSRTPGPATQVPPPVSVPSDAPPGPASESEEPGEFTRMFKAPSLDTPGQAVVDEPRATTGGTTPGGSARDTTPDEPGEFTRMFKAPTLGTPPDAGPQEAQARPDGTVPGGPASDAKPDEPGEFTRMFRRPDGIGAEGPPARDQTPTSAGPDGIPSQQPQEIPPEDPGRPMLPGQGPAPPYPISAQATPDLGPGPPEPRPLTETGDRTAMPPAAGGPPPPALGPTPPAHDPPSTKETSTPVQGGVPTQGQPGSGSPVKGAPPGEFTRMFGALDAPTPSGPPQPMPPAARGPTPPSVPKLPEQPTPPSVPKLPEQRTPPSVPQLEPPTPPGQGPSGPSGGDFTRMFRNPGVTPPRPKDVPFAPAAPPAHGPTPANVGDDYLSRLHGAGTGRPTPPPPQPGRGPAPPPQRSGPGEYTRVIAASSLSSGMAPSAPTPTWAPPKPPKSAPPDRGKPSLIPVIIGLSVVGVIAIAIVIVLILR